MLAYAPMLPYYYYAQNYASIIRQGLPLVSLLLRITAVQTGLVAATVCKFVHGGPAQNACVSCLHRCDEWTSVITCVNKSLVQALTSCPSEITPCTCCSANLSTFSRENSKSAGLVNACMDS